MSIVPFLRENAFDPTAIAILAAAFDAAWETVQKSGSPLASEAEATATRDRLAKRITEMGRQGERDHEHLVEDALAYLSGTP
jgi:hypothetical protein